jgi:hypothetical protein
VSQSLKLVTELLRAQTGSEDGVRARLDSAKQQFEANKQLVKAGGKAGGKAGEAATTQRQRAELRARVKALGR